MTGLPRSIIKKYGVTKKAWAVYRGSRSSGSSKRKMTASSRSRSVSSMGKKKGHRRSSGGFGLGGIPAPKKLLFAAIAAGAVYFGASKLVPQYADLAAMGAGALTAGGGILGMGIGALVGKAAGAPIANAVNGVVSGVGSGAGGSSGATF